MQSTETDTDREDQKTSEGRRIFDPLLSVLERICQIHKVPFNREMATAGLPLTEQGLLDPSTLLQAAKRLGLNGKVVKRKWKKIPRNVTPVIVFVKDGGAAVLEIDSEDGETLQCFIPSAKGGRLTQVEILKPDYIGYAIFFEQETKPIDGSVFDEHQDWKTWYWKTLWQFRSHYVQLIPASILINLFAVAMPFFIMLVYDRVVPNKAEETLWVLAIGVGLVFVFEFVVRLLRGVILERAGKRIDQTLANALFEHLLSIEMKSRPASGSMLSGQMKSYESLREFFMSASMLAVTDLPFGLLMIGVIFAIGGPIGWILVIAAAAAIGAELLLQPKLKQAVSKSSSWGLSRHALIAETANGIETIKGCNAEGRFQRRFEQIMKETSNSDVSSHWYGLVGSAITAFVLHFTTISIVIFSVYRVHAGLMTMGAMIACVMLASRCMAPVTMITGLMTRLQHAIEGYRGLKRFMSLSRESDGSKQFLALGKETITGKFELRNVTVQYPDQLKPALDDLSIRIKPGERIALLGKVGSGKSSLLRILAKLYEPQKGDVLLDDIALGQYQPAALRGFAGYLPQEAALFSGTMKENILSGLDSDDEEALMEVINSVGLTETLQKHPLGVNMQVGERGNLLSGGQRQAVALARVLIAQPKLLLLDEPTAAMDTNSAQTVRAAIESYLAEDPSRGLVMVTHNSKMVSVASRFVVVREGKIMMDSKGSVFSEDPAGKLSSLG